MEKLLVAISTLAAGAGAAIGGLVLNRARSSQKDSLKFGEVELAKDSIEDESFGDLEEEGVDSSELVEEEVKEEKDPVPEEPQKKVCSVYSVKTSNGWKAIKREEKFLEEIKDSKDRMKADKICSEKGSVYVAKYYGKWIYREDDQKRSWNIVPN